MATISLWDIKKEFVVFLRNQDLISISDRGVTTSQDTGTFASDNSHTLATNPTLVKNVRNVNVATSDLTFGNDYLVNYDTGVITFTSAQTGDYIIDYDQGPSDRIFPDFPQTSSKHVRFPRIAVEILSATTGEIELGGGSNFTDYVFTIVAYDKDHKDVETMIAAIRTAIINNKKNFFYVPFVTPRAMGPLIPPPWGEQKILQRNQDVVAEFIYED